MTSFDEWLVDRGPAMQSFAWLVTRAAHDTHEVLREALDRTSQHWGRFGSVDDAEASLRRDVVSAAARRPAAAPAPVAGDEVEQAWQATGRLTAEQRAVLALRFAEESSFGDVARILDLPEATVRSHVQEALSLLRGDGASAGFSDFTREESLLRTAMARHRDDLDMPVEFVPARRQSHPERWVAAAAALAVLAGGGYWLANRSASEPAASPSSAVPTWASPTATPTETWSETPQAAPTATEAQTPLETPDVFATQTTTPVATAVATTPAAAAPTPVTSTSATPGFTPNASGNEYGDYNPNDPTAAPSDRLAIDTPVTSTGWGAYQLGTSQKDLKARGLVVADPSRCQGALAATTVHRTIGVRQLDSDDTHGLTGIEIANPVVRTDKGATVSMTMAEVQKLYGADFAFEPKQAQAGKPMVMARVRQGADEIVFVTVDGNGRYVPATPASKVTSMVVRRYAPTMPTHGTC